MIEESFDKEMAAEIIQAATTSRKYEKWPSRNNFDERGSKISKIQRNFKLLTALF